MKTMEKMIEILKRCQELQAEVMVMNDGHSLHVDIMSLKYSETGNYRVSVTVTLFHEGGKIENDWDFNFYDSDEEIAAKATQMEEYIENLK